LQQQRKLRKKMDQALQPKDITSAFVQQGLYLRPKGLNLLKGFLNKKTKVEGKKLLLSIISSVFTVIQNNQDLADG
jgi:hypothetical protein